MRVLLPVAATQCQGRLASRSQNSRDEIQSLQFWPSRFGADHGKLFFPRHRVSRICVRHVYRMRCPRLLPSRYSARHGNTIHDDQRRFAKGRNSSVAGLNGGRIGARFWRRRRGGSGWRCRSSQILPDLPTRTGSAKLPVSSRRQFASQSALPTGGILRHAQRHLRGWSHAERLAALLSGRADADDFRTAMHPDVAPTANVVRPLNARRADRARLASLRSADR